MSINYNRIPRSTKLFCDYLYNFPAVRQFYSHRPHRVFRLPKRTMGKSCPRDAVVDRLMELNGGYGCSEQTVANIELLRQPSAKAVVTGQQVGLFGGPLYTLYKALTAIKLSRQLQQSSNCAVVPVFWMETEDHDFQEASRVCLIDDENEIAVLIFRSDSPPARQPVGSIELGPAADDFIETVAHRTPNTEFKEELLQTLKSCYGATATFAQGFARLLIFLLGQLGLIIVDPSDQHLKRLVAPIFEREISSAPRSAQLVAQQSKKLVEAGYHCQIEPRHQSANLFLLHGRERSPIVMEDGAFIDHGKAKRFTRSELLGRLRRHPELFSPNVVLRPVVQDFLIPTVAYVAGPAEIAYFAQLKSVYHHFDVPLPIIYPRAGMTLVETSIQRTLHDHDLNVEDFFQNEDQVIALALTRTFPDDIDEVLHSSQTGIDELLTAVEGKVISFDPTLSGFLSTSRGKINHQLTRIRKKVLRSHRRQHEIVRAQLSRASHHLYPTGKLQERVLTLIPWLMRHGFGLIDRLYRDMDIEGFQHQIVYL